MMADIIMGLLLTIENINQIYIIFFNNYNHTVDGTTFIIQPKEITNVKEFLGLLKDPKGADKTKTKATKKSTYASTQPSSSRRALELLNSKSEEADTSTPSRLISQLLSKPSNPALEKMLKKSRSKREESSLKRIKNDQETYLNSIIYHKSSYPRAIGQKLILFSKEILEPNKNFKIEKSKYIR